MKLHFALVFSIPRERTVEFHSHQVLELVYYVSGTGSSRINGRNHPVGPGIFTLTPAGMRHDQRNEATVKSLCFGLDHSGLESLAGAWADPDGMLQPVLERLMDEATVPRPGGELVCQGLLLQAKGLVLRIAGGRSKKEELVTRAEHLIHERGGRIDLDDLAGALFVSKDHFRHLYKEVTNQSPLQAIIQVRIQRAQALLARPDLPLKEIAEQAGFPDLYSFSRMFKKETALTPSRYRQQVAGKRK